MVTVAEAIPVLIDCELAVGCESTSFPRPEVREAANVARERGLFSEIEYFDYRIGHPCNSWRGGIARDIMVQWGWASAVYAPLL